MKKFFLILNIVLFTSLSAYSGVFESSKNLNTLETEHFDIIFDNQSINEAFEIYNNCERIYENIQSFFGIERSQRIPVAITSDMDSFNAYFSGFPSPHIVLYNTIIANNGFNYFSSNYLLNVFSHELTHALTLMGSNNFIQKTFSQFLNFSTLNTTMFNSEGFAVLFESSKGEGRLNNNLYKSQLLQAKAENKFLKYNETQGNRDIYPSNIFYLYGAFFNEYLYDTYGKDKYHEFINSQHKLNLLFIDQNILFKRVYGKSVYDVYNDFKNSFIDINTKDIVIDEFDYNPTQLFKNDENALVYQTRNNSIRKIENSKKILSLLDYSYYISYNDNKYVLSGFKSDNLQKTITYVFDENYNRSTYKIDNFIQAINYNNQLVGILYEGQKQYIAFYDGANLIKKIDVEDDEYIQKIDVIDDKIIFTSRYNQRDCLNIILDDYTRKTIYFKDNDIEIIDFSINDNLIYLSIIKQNQLARIAYIDLIQEIAYINDFDVLGGIFNPIVLNDNLYYISNFSDKKIVRKTNLNQFNFKKEDIIIENNTIIGHKMINYDLSGIKKYNKFKYINKGSFFPYIYADEKGLNTGIYFKSIDPSETLDTTILNNTALYNNFSNTLNLQLSNYTGSKATQLILNYDSELLNLYNSSNLDLQYNYIKYFDLNNNFNLKIDNSVTSYNFETFIDELSYGILFKTNIGPNIENYFSLYLGNTTALKYEKIANLFSDYNQIEANIYIPYLLPFIKNTNMVINMPSSLTLKYNIDTNDLDYQFKILILKKEIQSAFEKIPLYFHNFQTYLSYNSDNNIDLYMLLTNSLTQTGLFQGQLSPGINVNYDFDNKNFTYKFGIYSQF